MCGIVGVISRGWTDSSICKYFNDAMITGSVRGTDSCGILQVDKKGMVYVEKKAISAPDFLERKHTAGLVSDVDGSLLTIGHHRAATNGKVVDKNAHPFEIHIPNHGVFAGVHNGSLTSWNKKDTDLSDEEFEVDSHWALAKIAKEGTKALSDIRGPFVFAWYDPRERGKAFLARGTGRPICIANVEGHGNGPVAYTLFASEAGMISWLAERNNLRLVDRKIFEVPENTLITFNINKPGELEASSFTPASYSHNYNYQGSSGGVSYTETSRNKFVSELKRIIQDAKDELSGKKKTPNNPTEKKSDTPSIEKAKQAGLFDETVVFAAMDYDPKSKIITGDCYPDTTQAQDIYRFRMHGIDEDLANALLMSDWGEAKVRACSTTTAKEDALWEFGYVEGHVLVLSRPLVVAAKDDATQKKIDSILNARKKQAVGVQ